MRNSVGKSTVVKGLKLKYRESNHPVENNFRKFQIEGFHFLSN